MTSGKFALGSRPAFILLLPEYITRADRNEVRVAGDVKMFGRSSTSIRRRDAVRLEPASCLPGLASFPSFFTGRNDWKAEFRTEDCVSPAVSIAEAGTATLSSSNRVPKERLDDNIARFRKAGS